MRLLYFQDNGSLACTEFGRHNIPQYAILSHTWGDEEVTLQDHFHGTSTDLSGYRKITFCGEQAVKDGLKYFWVDTCCIDKRNLPELTKAINSMFRWYRNAAKCYVYLSDVSVPSTGDMEVDENSWIEAFRKSRWFTRGWTLQELIAPESVDFFSAEGRFLGSKQSLELEITQITGIPIEALRGQSLSDFSASERFTWAENRETSEEEDIAYCLLGIFDVFMPLIYGEGEANALKRLEKLLNESLNDNLLGGIEETEDHSDVNSPSSSIPGGSRNSKHSIEASDDEGRKRRKAYVLKELGPARALIRNPRLRRHESNVILNPWHQALCLSRDVAQGANAGSIFQEAHVSFLNAVYWDEWPRFETFTDRLEMMADILSHCENDKYSSRLLLACKHIDDFSSRWTHFFTVVEFAMDIDPEWPRTVWGAIRLIFVRCKGFVNMFEKLAHMLDKMRQRLPSYHDHVLRLHDDCPEALKSHLGKALAFVYADVLQFCHDACLLFRISPGETEVGLDPVKDLLSTTFVVCFGSLLERLSEHKGLFDIELRAGRHTSLKHFIRKVTQALEDREQFMQDSEMRRYLEDEKMTRDRGFHESIRNWVQPPEFKADFDKAKKARSFGSCTWLQSKPAYVSWKAELQTIESGHRNHGKSKARPCQPVLWLEGPPGYGKTILSTAIIEDLSSIVSTNPAATNGQPRNEVVYFYFNAQMLGKQSYCDALRAMAIQIAEALRNDTEMIDLVSILMIRDDGGRSIASDDDLMEFLLLSFRRFSSLALILDGIDECRDFERMWPFLSTACMDKRIKCLILGRPLVKIPSENAHLVLRQSLIGMNEQDICNYLRQEIQNLQMAGHLQEHLISDRIADTLTSRANSRFLWASLMISYLGSPALSPTDRAQEIENSSQLETLHGLYSGMLRQFESLFSQERTLLTKIFQFLVLSKEPPSVEQLNIAISVKPGCKLSKRDQVPNITDTIRRFCGALIDIGPDSTVLFSHLSFRVFLLSGEAKQLRTPFRVDLKAGSLRIAVVCLSYLVNDVPQGPLAGSPNTAANKAEIALQMPFSEYSTRYWVGHAVCALQLMPGTLRELISDCYPLLQQLGSFLSRKASISAWIEACWTYNFQPSIETLWQELETRLEQINTGAQRNSMEWRISESLSQIRALSEDLKKLNEHWSHLLSVRPHEIWGASISVFLGPGSWAHNDEAKVTAIANEGANEYLEETILKVSKLSVCGKYLGTVRLSRSSAARKSKEFTPCTCGHKVCVCSQNTSPVDLQGAVASYQILEMKLGFPIAKNFLINLDTEDLGEVERTAEGPNFRFPVAFSPNLQRIAILRTLFWIGQDGSFQQQRINLPLPQPIPPSIPAERRKWRPKNSRRKIVETEQPQQIPALKSIFYKLKFSPCGQYVAIVERQDDKNEFSEGHWNFTIWKKESADASAAQNSAWQQIETLCDIYGDFLNDGNFVFNPQFQMIALLEIAQVPGNQASIWKFGTPTNGKPRTTMVYGTGLRNLHHSPCGYFLFGDHFYYGTIRMVHLEGYLADAIPVPPPSPESVDDLELSDVEMMDGSEDGFTHVSKTTSTQLILAEEYRHTVLSSNTLTLAAPNGVPELSTVRSYADGAVVLKRFSSLVDDERCLLYLPNRTDACTSVSILDDSEGSPDTVRMVLTTDFQDSYTWDNPLNQQSASIITRPVQSIQQYKLPNAQHRIAYEAGELSHMPNASAQELLTLEGDAFYDACD